LNYDFGFSATVLPVSIYILLEQGEGKDTMTLAVPKELQAALIGLGGAALGYAFREYRNRAHPFFQITEVDGTATKRTDRTELSEVTSEKLFDTFFLEKVERNTDLGTLSDCNRTIRHMTKVWPQNKPSIEQILSATEDTSMCAVLASALGWRSVDNWLTQFLMSDRMHDDNEGNKSQVWFLFPKKGTNFGNHFTNKAVRAKCEPLIQAIRFLHHEIIKNAFKQFSYVVEKEYQKTIECQSEVKNKVDEKSRWCFYCYLANLSNFPVVIEKDGYVHVHDKKTKMKYKEPCYLLPIRRDNKGERVLQDTNTPLVIKQGGDCEFAFITKSAQSGMELGKALREAFYRAQRQ
jgi:hypothetical protein